MLRASRTDRLFVYVFLLLSESSSFISFLKSSRGPLCTIKPRPNDRNMPTQHIATLLGATWCVRLATHVAPNNNNNNNNDNYVLDIAPFNMKMIKSAMLHWRVAIVWPGLNVFIDQFIVTTFYWFSKPLHVYRFFDISALQTKLLFDWLRNRHVSTPLMTVTSGNRTGCHFALVRDFTRLEILYFSFFCLKFMCFFFRVL